MKVFYYYYYLFYTKVLPDRQPHLTVVWALSLSISFLVTGILELLSVKFFKYNIDSNYLIGVAALVFLINYLIFIKGGKGKQIVEQKPLFFGNEKFSKVITIAFFVLTLLFSFFLPFYLKTLINKP